MPLKQRIRSFSTMTPLLVIFLALVQYRPDSAADFGMYAKGGELVANGENPYTYTPFRSGPLIALLTHFILRISPNTLTLIQVLTIIGIYFFIKTLLAGTQYDELVALSLTGVLLLTISGRSLLSNIQITAYTLTLLGAIYRGLFDSFIKRPWLTKIFIIFCGVLLIDVRIQLGLILLVYFVKARQFALLIGTSAAWVFVQGFLFLFSGLNYSELFIKRLQELSEETLISGLSISPWRLAAEIGIPTSLVAVLSYLSVAILIFSLCLRLDNNQIFLILFAVPPLLLVYVHPYDLLLPLIVFLCVMLKAGNVKMTAFIFLIGLLSPSYLSNFLFSLIVLVLILANTTQFLILLKRQSKDRLFHGHKWPMEVRWLLVGFVVSMCLSIFLDETTRLSIVTLVASLAILLSQGLWNELPRFSKESEQ